MTKSRQDLINRALEELGAIAAGQAGEAEDVAVIESEINPVMGDLATRGIYSWGLGDEFDDDAFIHLAVILANSRANTFGKQPDDRVRLYAESRLRQLNVSILSGQRQTPEYF